MVAKWGDDDPFSGRTPGLDSIDALELVLGLQKEFGVTIEDQTVAIKVMATINTIASSFTRREGVGRWGGPLSSFPTSVLPLRRPHPGVRARGKVVALKNVTCGSLTCRASPEPVDARGVLLEAMTQPPGSWSPPGRQLSSPGADVGQSGRIAGDRLAIEATLSRGTVPPRCDVKATVDGD